jgi:hypothetical protein
MRTPDEVYEPSKRTKIDDDSDFEYPEEFEVRRVRKDGSIKWERGFIFVGEAFQGELVGLEALDEVHSEVRLGPMPLGILNDRLRTVMPIEAEA